jgi:hypothetical protein
VPRPIPKEKIADKKKSDKPVSRTLERGSSTAPIVVEEKRK